MTTNYPESDQIILATGGYDHTIKLWQTHTEMCSRTMQHPDAHVNALAITPNRQSLACASYQHIYMYDLISNNPNPIINYEGTSKNVTDVGFQEDGKWMYSVGEDCKARIWDFKGKDPISNQFPTKSPVNCACLHPNQNELFIGDQSGIIYRWDLRTDMYEKFIPESDAMILNLSIDPCGNFMAAVNNKGSCYIWSLDSGKKDEPTKMVPKQKFQAHPRHVLKCKFSPDSTLLATTSADQTARIWRTTDFSLLQSLEQENQRWVWDCAFSNDSQYLFTASSDGVAKAWNIESGLMEKEYTGHQKAITALAFKDVGI